ncbi:MAG: arsenosugar biosynthesis radical SAM protein ArsS [Nitrospirae bacterium]|nr:arsenosugar biosynthesis radical SAM protein ArsS [Nitrospirota bacterium]
MNIFNQKLENAGKLPLRARSLSILEANVGYRCNLRCTHCYVDASPERTEEMSLETINTILNILKDNDGITTLDITGGAPELNPHFRYFVKTASALGKKVLVRTNLAVMTEPGMNDIPELLAASKAKVIASLPCFSEEGVDIQRGKGTYKKAISVLKKLNSLGYGKDSSGLELDLVFNPAGASLAPDSKLVENAYKSKLMEMHGIVFNHLIALNNAPIGRMRRSVSDETVRKFEKEIEEKFNPAAVENVMCRFIINVSPDGALFDCDCNQMARLALKNGNSTLAGFDYDKLKNREIVTTSLCFGCTAGAGSSCMPQNETSSSCATKASPSSQKSCSTDITGLVSYEEVLDARVKEIFDQLISSFHKVLPVYRVRSFVNDPAWMDVYHNSIMDKFTPKHLDFKTLFFVEFASDIAARWEYCIGGAYDKCLDAAGITPAQINKTIKLVSACSALSYLEKGFNVFSASQDAELDFMGLVNADDVRNEQVQKIYSEIREILGDVPEVYRVRSLMEDAAWLQVFHDSMKLYFTPDVLDAKTIHLICIGALTVLQSNQGVRRHAKLAIKAGATPEEISEAIRGCYVNAYVFSTSAGFGIFKYSKE